MKLLELPLLSLLENHWLSVPQPGCVDWSAVTHSGVISLGRSVLHSCEPLSAGLLLWLEVLLNISFICKKMFCYFSAKFLVGPGLFGVQSVSFCWAALQ